MSLDLTVPGSINTTPQQVSDQNNNSCPLYLSNASLNIPCNTSLIFGIDGNGTGESISNTQAVSSGTYGVSLSANYNEQLRVTSGGFMLPNLLHRPSTGTTDLTIDSNGNVTPQTSTLRLKEDVRQLDDDFYKVLNLSPISFKYKQSGEHGIGYAAEQLDQENLHNLVTYDSEGKPLSVNYKMISVYLAEIVKKQQSKLTSLEGTLSQCEQRIRKLENS